MLQNFTAPNFLCHPIRSFLLECSKFALHFVEERIWATKSWILVTPTSRDWNRVFYIQLIAPQTRNNSIKSGNQGLKTAFDTQASMVTIPLFKKKWSSFEILNQSVESGSGNLSVTTTYDGVKMLLRAEGILHRGWIRVRVRVRVKLFNNTDNGEI